MKLKYRVGCLIEAGQSSLVDVVVHTHNCFNKMNSEVALKVAEAFPEAVSVDVSTASGDIRKLGDLTHAVVHRGETSILVVNLYTQFTYGIIKMHVDYTAFEASLDKLVSMFVDTSLSIGFSKMDAGFVDGYWHLIEYILQTKLVDKGFDVTVYVQSEEDIPN